MSYTFQKQVSGVTDGSVGMPCWHKFQKFEKALQGDM